MHALYLISVLFHLLAAMAWVGAMIFLMAIIVPILRKGDRAAGAALLSASGPRLRTLGWVAFAVLVVTGTFNLAVRGVRFADFTSRAWLGSGFGHLVVMKLTLFAVVVGVSAFHDFSLGPRAADAVARDPSSAESQRLRRTASLLGRFNALLALAIVALAVMLVRGSPF